MTRVSLPATYAKGYSAPFSVEYLQNMMVLARDIRQQNARVDYVLINTPGLRLFSNLNASNNDEIRGLHVCGGVLYAVAGTLLYSIDVNGAATSIGTINGTQPVKFANNGTWLVIVADSVSYAYNTGTATLSQITDPDFITASDVTYLKGYFIFKKAALPKQFFISSLEDPTSFDATDFASVNSSPGNITKLFGAYGDLWIFLEDSIEIWRNTGSADFPFEPTDGAAQEIGCGAMGSVAKIERSIFWLGSDNSIYQARGYQPQIISTDSISREIEAMSDFSDAVGFCYTQHNKKFYVISFPTGGKTFVFDLSTQLWHERSSEGRNRWLGTYGVTAYRKTFVGGYDSDVIYQVDMDWYSDNENEIIRIVQGLMVQDNNNAVSHNQVELLFETGVGTASGSATDPQVMLSWSDDGGRIFGNEAQRSAGLIGANRTRLQWNRLGQADNGRVYKIRMSAKVKWVLLAADMILEQKYPK